jgi:hypothetical protein
MIPSESSAGAWSALLLRREGTKRASSDTSGIEKKMQITTEKRKRKHGNMKTNRKEKKKKEYRKGEMTERDRKGNGSKTNKKHPTLLALLARLTLRPSADPCAC